MTTPLMRVDTTVNTNVKGSKVFGLAFVKVDGVTDSFTEAEVRAFVLPKLNTESAIVQLDNTSSGENYHSGRGDEIFTGILTKVFSNGIVDDTVTLDSADFATTGVNVYFLTMDGINNTAVKSVYAPYTFTFTINGKEYSRSASDPVYQITLDEETDADATKTPWVLVANMVRTLDVTSGSQTWSYMADPVRTIAHGLPVSDNTFSDVYDVATQQFKLPGWNEVGTDQTVVHGDTNKSVGYTEADFFDKMCDALGPDGLEVRFRGVRQNHVGNSNGNPYETEVKHVHFRTSDTDVILNFRGKSLGVKTRALQNHTLLDGHNRTDPGSIPQGISGIGRVYASGYLNGTTDMGLAPFNSPTGGWGIRAWTDGRTNEWEYWNVDETDLCYYGKSVHQIWVRANK